MHPRTQELLTHLDRTRQALRAAVNHVPPALRDQRPTPSCWSVAEVLEHLVLIERRVTQLLTSQLVAAQSHGLAVEHETSSVLETLDMEAILDRLLDRSRTVPAPPMVQPQMALDAAAALAALEETRMGFREAVLAGDGLALGTLVQPHPVLGPLNLYQWIVVLGGHEERHAVQIREIASVLATQE